MEAQVTKKKVKRINVNLDKCMGCRACEVACSGFHASPKWSTFNPARSRIRVDIDLLNDQYVPIRSTEIAKVECDGRNKYTVNGKEYSECSFCGSICPSRDMFKEPDSGLPLKCDLCEDDPAVEIPWCVQVCKVDALTYEETEEEVEEEKLDGIDEGLESMVTKYGLDKVLETIARMSKKD